MGISWGDVGRVAMGVGTLGVSEMLRDQGESQEKRMQQAANYAASKIHRPSQSLFQDHYSRAVSGQMLDAARDRAGLQVGQDTRTRQMELADAMRARAMGQGGPSVAQNQLNQAMDRRVADARSMAVSQDGISPAAAAYLAQRGSERAMSDTAGQMATLRAQEQIAAQQQLGGLLGGVRGQDLSTQQATDQATQNYYRLGLGANQQFQNARQNFANTDLQAQMAQANAIGGGYQAAAQARNQYNNMLLGTAANTVGRLIPLAGE